MVGVTLGSPVIQYLGWRDLFWGQLMLLVVAAGIALAYSCREGACGTCKLRLVSGQVQMDHNGGIRQREIDRGMILICCSHPLSDLVIE